MSVTEPIILSQDFAPPDGTFDLVVPEDLFFLQGHFPEVAVVPGVVQIHWAICLASQGLTLRPKFLGIESLKFHLIIKPLTELKLELNYAEASGKLRFCYTSEAGQHSQGRILLD